MKYVDRLQTAMEMLAARYAVFLGQAIAYPGTGMTQSFKNVPREQLFELPVAEDLQLGMAIGMSLVDPSRPIVSVYPRINFLFCAMNQLILHLDALPRYSEYRPRVIIRTAIATPVPLDPGPQHLGDYSGAIQAMLQTVHVERLLRGCDIVEAYRQAAMRSGSSLLIEYTDLYDTEATP